MESSGANGHGRSGVALLLTLLVLVAATLLAHAAFLLALGEGQGVTRQRQLLEGWEAVERRLERAPEGGISGPGQLLELPDGYMLQWVEVELPPAPGTGRGPSLRGGRIWWRLDAREVAARIHGARAGAGQAGEAQLLGEQLPLRLGPLTLEDWRRWVPWEALEDAGQTVAYRYPSGGTGPSVVWAPGSLELPLAGLPLALVGLVLVEGELALQEGASIHGGVVAGGSIRMMEGGQGLVWDPAPVEDALSLLAQTLGTRAVPGGWLSPFPW